MTVRSLTASGNCPILPGFRKSGKTPRSCKQCTTGIVMSYPSHLVMLRSPECKFIIAGSAGTALHKYTYVGEISMCDHSTHRVLTGLRISGFGSQCLSQNSSAIFPNRDTCRGSHGHDIFHFSPFLVDQPRGSHDDWNSSSQTALNSVRERKESERNDTATGSHRKARD